MSRAAVTRESAVLRGLTLDDAAATCRWLQDAELRALIDSTAPPSPAGNDEYWRRRLADPNERCYAVLDRGRHVGNCGLRVDPARSKAELWLYLAEGRRRGLGGAAVDELLRVAFVDLALNRVHLRAVETNAAALAFWRSCGFVEEGRAREDTWIDGRAVDSIWFSLLRREWEERRRRVVQ